MVLNILGQKSPLYKVQEFYQKQDVELLFGSDVKPEQFNDDSLGRALDYLYEADPWKVNTPLALSTLNQLNVALDTLHCETTSFSVSGDYLPDSSSSGLSEKEPLSVTYGYSKQKRPDLKQIVLGMGVTPQGIPIVAKVENGNTSDVKWNMEFVQKLCETLSEENWSNLLYQADSALISKGNLQDLAAHQLDFLSWLPDTFRLSTELKSKAWKNNKWEVIGKLTSQTNGSNYRYQAFEEELEGQNLQPKIGKVEDKKVN